MATSYFDMLLSHYRWDLSIMAAIGIAAATFIGKQLLLFVPKFKQAHQINNSALFLAIGRRRAGRVAPVIHPQRLGPVGRMAAQVLL